MAKSAVRQVSIFINGKEVENTIKGIAAAQVKLNNELKLTVRGTDEYEKKAFELQRVNAIISEHSQRLKGVQQGWSLAKIGIDKLVGVAAGAFAVDSLIGYGKQLFGVGVQMDTLQRKAAVVFGTSLPQVTAEADKNAKAIGLTTAQYVSAAAAIQDLLIPMGFQRKEAAGISTQLVNLSGALSEWTGGQIKAEDVSKILTKALLGERDELKQLGISITDADIKAQLAAKGMDKLTGAALEQAKASITLELVLAKSTDAQAAFAKGGESAVRRQAELAAKIADVTEKIATLLLPVFEALANIASTVIGAIGGIAGAIGDMIDPVEASSRAFDEQATKVNDLQTNISPLLDRYDVLSTKTNLNAGEQDELKKIIEKVSSVIPSAITGFDAYGNALGLNTTKAREFIEVEKARLKFINQAAIKENESFIKEIQRQQAEINQQLGTGQKDVAVRGAGGEVSSRKRSINEDEIRSLQAAAAKLQETLVGANAEISRLKGENLNAPAVVPEVKNSGGTGGGGTTSKDKVKEAEETESQIIAFALKRAEVLSNLNAAQQKAEQDAAAQTLATQQAAFDAYVENKDQIKLVDISYEEEKAAAQTLVAEALLTDREAEILALQEHYNQLLFVAETYGIDTAALRSKQETELAAINKKFADEEMKKQAELQQAKLAALGTMFTEFGNVVTATFDLLGAEGEKSAGFQKIATLAKIAFDTASAISSLVASSEAVGLAAGPAAPFVAVATYAAGIVRILGNINQAKKLLQSAPAVKQKFEGSYLPVTGASDGRQYNARTIGTPSTGLLPHYPVLFNSNATNAPVLASERGAEYFVASQDLQRPYVANLVRMIDLATHGGRGIPQFAEGGVNSTGTSAGTPANTPELSAIVLQATQAINTLNALLARGVIAVVPDGTVLDIQARVAKLNAISGGYFQ